jgi:hypothetical protein
MTVKSKKNAVIVLCAVALLLLCLGVALYIRPSDHDSPLPLDISAVTWEGMRNNRPKQASSGSVCIPGFDSLSFITGTTTQNVNFYNPEENGDRLFKFTLFVEEEKIWGSEYIPAGNGFYEIETSREFTPGEYAGYLRVQVYRPDGTEVNGARVEFILNVTEETS